MGLLGRKKEVVLGNVCPICNMEFADATRMMRHMVKAHRKKKFECDSCGFRN